MAAEARAVNVHTLAGLVVSSIRRLEDVNRRGELADRDEREIVGAIRDLKRAEERIEDLERAAAKALYGHTR